MESLIGRTLDGYKILEIIGRGGMGVVFKALDTNLDKIVALKMIDPGLAKDETFIRRFKTEARALAKLNNPNIVGVYALRETESYFFMVMEFVEHKPLSQCIRENGRLNNREILNISKQLLSAVGFAHKADIIHRDIKPSNILICPDGTIKVTDFGLAKVIKQHDNASTITQARAGTLYYMSPEQVKGLKNVDKRGDLYSLGMTLYEMTAGRVPFDKTDSDFTIQRKIVDGEIPSPIVFCKDVPKRLIKIIRKSIDKDPEKRYQTAEDILEDILKLEVDLQDDEKTVLVYKAKSKVKSKPAFNKFLLAGAGLIFLISAVLVYSWFISPPGDNGKAYISISTNPPDAEIKINGEIIQNSQLDKLAFEKDEEVKIQINKYGYTSIDTVVETKFGKTIKLSFSLADASALIRNASLTLSTRPAGANIYLNDNPIGISPIKDHTAAAGDISLDIEMPGYVTIDTLVRIFEEKNNTFNFILNKVKEYGMLSVTSDPSGAEVWIDRKKAGITPFNEPAIPAGTHQVVVRKYGFSDYKQTIKISSLQAAVIPNVKLMQHGKLDISTDPLEAEILLDNKSVGKGRFTSDEIIPGEHDITVRNAGFKIYTEKLRVGTDKPVNRTVKLTPVTGRLEILVRPFGDIYIDDRLVKGGTSGPFTTEIQGGSHRLRVVHQTLGEWQKNIEINDEKSRRYIIDFSRSMKLTITSRPSYAEIYINGKETGETTPKMHSFKPGTYKIKLKKDNYESPEREYKVDYDIYESLEDKTDNISFDLNKID